MFVKFRINHLIDVCTIMKNCTSSVKNVQIKFRRNQLCLNIFSLILFCRLLRFWFWYQKNATKLSHHAFFLLNFCCQFLSKHWAQPVLECHISHPAIYVGLLKSLEMMAYKCLLTLMWIRHHGKITANICCASPVAAEHFNMVKINLNLEVICSL